MPFPVGYSGIYNSSVAQHFKVGPLQQAIQMVLLLSSMMVLYHVNDWVQKAHSAWQMKRVLKGKVTKGCNLLSRGHFILRWYQWGISK